MNASQLEKIFEVEQAKLNTVVESFLALDPNATNFNQTEFDRMHMAVEVQRARMHMAFEIFIMARRAELKG